MTDMTLTTYPDLVQGSQEWLDARRGIVTASTISKLLTPQLKVADNDTSRGLINTLAAERITGNVDYVYPSFDMQRGTEREPYARQYYADTHSPVTEMGFMVRDFGGYVIGYSPDGLVGEDGLVEIKSPRAKEHLRTILANDVPAQYMAQCQTGLLVSGRDWLDYVSFCPGMPLWTKRVHPDHAWSDALKEAADIAESRIQSVTAMYEASVIGLPATEAIPELEEIVI